MSRPTVALIPLTFPLHQAAQTSHPISRSDRIPLSGTPAERTAHNSLSTRGQDRNPFYPTHRPSHPTPLRFSTNLYSYQNSFLSAAPPHAQTQKLTTLLNYQRDMSYLPPPSKKGCKAATAVGNLHPTTSSMQPLPRAVPSPFSGMRSKRATASRFGTPGLAPAPYHSRQPPRSSPGR
jgi:hypothetical protein